MSSQSQELGEMLRFDPLHEAEKLTGESYKQSDVTSSLGLLMSIEHNKKLREALESQDDTVLLNQLDNYVRIITEEGFESVLTIPFIGNNKADESLNIYWHRDGILLVFDTYDTDRVNGGKYLYNWVPDDWSTRCRYTSSGGLETHEGQDVWCGSHDCREALRHNIRQLRDNGEFLSTWIRQPFIWLLHYMDTKEEGYDYEEINQQRIAMLPQYVQDAISG